MSGPIRRVAFLGTGAMGRPMAENLAKVGLHVRAWDPVPDAARAVAGATPFDRAAAAAAEADAVVTMAPDGPAVERTMFGDGVADAMRRDALWLQTSTTGVRWAEELAARAAARSLLVVDAPVIGTLPEAESGGLYFFASGPEPARPLCQPLLDVMGARTFWYDRPGDGQRMKLALNGWLLTLIELAAESLALVEGLGLDPRQFLEILDGHAVGSPLLQRAGSAMLDGNFEGGLRLALAHKDLGLIEEAADEAGVELALVPATRRKMAAALELGYADASAGATFVATRRSVTRKEGTCS
jgi:3-hydroxyisobutyrate dehydrogenase